MRLRVRRDAWLPYAFIAPTFVLIALLMIQPLAANLLYGFFDIQLFNPGNGRPFVGWGNYTQLLTDPTFWLALGNSLWFTALSVAFQILFGLMLALLFNRRFKGRGLARGLALIPWMVPYVVVALTWKWMFDGSVGIINHLLVLLHLTDTYRAWFTEPASAMTALIIINVWKGIPFNLITFLAGMQSISGDLYEAAQLDGANRWQQFVRITLPLLKPQVIVLTLLGIIWTFRSFDLVFITTGGGPVNATMILPVMAYKYSFEFAQVGKGSAVANLMFLVMMVFAFLYLRGMRGDETHE